jgi:hypothetical protein
MDVEKCREKAGQPFPITNNHAKGMSLQPSIDTPYLDDCRCSLAYASTFSENVVRRRWDLLPVVDM